MAKSLLAKLDELAHLTPDEIVKQLNLPLPKWRRLNTFTREEYEELANVVVTLFNTRQEVYYGSHRLFERRHSNSVCFWSYETFSNARSGNAHWYVINNENAYPFQMGIDNVEAD